MKYLKKITASFFVLTIVLFVVFVHFKTIHKNISENIIRMHIIANSDSLYDQQIKLEIRDRILNKYSFAAKDIQGEKEYIKNNIDFIVNDVNSWLYEKGVPYKAKASLKKDYFPTKNYGGLSLPKGNYTAFKVILGKGNGKNWWCVMFPPLCFADSCVGTLDVKSEEYLKENLSKEEYKLVTKGGTKIKFKIMEFFN